MGYKVKDPGNCLICGSPEICARRLCRRHYSAARKNGTLAGYPVYSEKEAFLSRFKKTPKCWIWQGTRNEYGYGIFLLPGEIPVRAHRYSFENFKGEIPDNMVVMHTCDNPPCVNPDHLRLGTKADNNKDTAMKRRHNYGLKHWNGKLSEKQVAEIRNSDKTQRELAEIYGISHGYAGSIKRGEERPKR